MNIKLKDLLQEQVIIKSDDEVGLDSVTSVSTSSTLKPKNQTQSDDESDKENIVDDILIDNKINQARYKMLGKYAKYRNTLYDGGKVEFSSSDISNSLSGNESTSSLSIPAGVYTNLNKQKQDLVYDKIFAKTEKPDTRETKTFKMGTYNQNIINLIKNVGWKQGQTKRDRVQILYKGNHVINCAKMTIGYGGVPSIGGFNDAKGVGRLKYKYSFYFTNDGTKINSTEGFNINELYVQYNNKDYSFTKFITWSWN
jgi:hypothetical protein